MGMYTELYLGVELIANLPMGLKNWLFANNASEKKSIEEIRELCTDDELKASRLSTLHGDSYYFDAQQHYSFIYDAISKAHYLTMGLNIKNYDDEINKFLKLIEPYISSLGHIGHARYEEHDFPTILIYDGDKIVEYEVNENKKGNRL